MVEGGLGRGRGEEESPAMPASFRGHRSPALSPSPEFLALKHNSRILGHSSNPVCGFSIMEQVRLCAVWPTENWLGSSLNNIQGTTTVRESYSSAFRSRNSAHPTAAPSGSEGAQEVDDGICSEVHIPL